MEGESVPNKAPNPVASTAQVWIGVSIDTNPAEDIAYAYNGGLVPLSFPNGNFEVDVLTSGFLGLTNLLVSGQTSSVSIPDGVIIGAQARDVGTIPEPGTFTLIGLGLAGIGCRRQRSK